MNLTLRRLEKLALFEKIGTHYSHTRQINIIPPHFSCTVVYPKSVDAIRLFSSEVSWCQNCFVCAFLCVFPEFFIVFILHARHAELPTTPVCSHIEEEEKRMTSAVSALAAACTLCTRRSGFGERIFTVYVLYIRKWSTVLQHPTMVSTCRTHWVILGHWHLLNLCVFSQWKLRFPREKLTQFPYHPWPTCMRPHQLM